MSGAGLALQLGDFSFYCNTCHEPIAPLSQSRLARLCDRGLCHINGLRNSPTYFSVPASRQFWKVPSMLRCTGHVLQLSRAAAPCPTSPIPTSPHPPLRFLKQPQHVDPNHHLSITASNCSHSLSAAIMHKSLLKPALASYHQLHAAA